MLVNGNPTEEFRSFRGLWDPLTPFLFLIVVERLSGLVRQVVKENVFYGVEIGREHVQVHILQFA